MKLCFPGNLSPGEIRTPDPLLRRHEDQIAQTGSASQSRTLHSHRKSPSTTRTTTSTGQSAVRVSHTKHTALEGLSRIQVQSLWNQLRRTGNDGEGHERGC